MNKSRSLWENEKYQHFSNKKTQLQDKWVHLYHNPNVIYHTFIMLWGFWDILISDNMMLWSTNACYKVKLNAITNIWYISNTRHIEEIHNVVGIKWQLRRKGHLNLIACGKKIQNFDEFEFFYKKKRC